MPAIPLEDTVADVIGKAMRGLNRTDREVAALAGVSAAEVARLRAGAFDAAAARAIAPVLGLGAEALVALGQQTWFPAPAEVNHLACFHTRYGGMTVNNYLAVDPAGRTAVAFDTGADCKEMLEFLVRRNLKLEMILLTHTHGDHIAALGRLQRQTGAQAFVGDREPLARAESFPAGRTFACGSLRIATRLTWGHSPGGITYVIDGLARPVAIVGDAMFAGSMGGGAVSYQDALRTNREQILTLPDETVICPGHGPLTTVGEEKVHNPFFTA